MWFCLRPKIYEMEKKENKWNKMQINLQVQKMYGDTQDWKVTL